MGERGQSPLLYLGSPYLDFLDMDVSVDGTHSPTLATHRGQLTHGSQLTTHSPQVQYTGTQGIHTPSANQSASGDVPPDPSTRGHANPLVVTISTWTPSEQSEILE